jgi:hypothetical protein
MAHFQTWDIGACSCPLCGCDAPDTLTATSALFGVITLTRAAQVWTGTVNFAYTAGGGCAALTVPITYVIRSDVSGTSNCHLTIKWPWDGAACPAASGTPNSGVIQFPSTSTACSPLSIVWSIAAGGAGTSWNKLAHGASDTLTVTP